MVRLGPGRRERVDHRHGIAHTEPAFGDRVLEQGHLFVHELDAATATAYLIGLIGWMNRMAVAGDGEAAWRCRIGWWWRVMARRRGGTCERVGCEGAAARV